MAAVNAATLALLLLTSRRGVDRNGFLLGTDFLSFWTTGRMLHAGVNPYGQSAHIAAQQAYFAQANGFTAFFYPPTFLPFCWPLGGLGYFPALAVWLLITGTLFMWGVMRWLRAYPVARAPWLLLAAYPACVIQITHGQTAFLTAGLLMPGALWVRPRPWLAGILFGLATVKPQFGLLVPLVLVLTGEWRTIAAAALTSLALAGLSAAWFGPELWTDWFALTRAAQAAMDTGAVGYAKMVSPFAGMMLLGIPAPLAYIGQALASLGVAAMLGRAAWRRSYTPELGALMLVGAVLVTPFVLDYDMLLIAPVLIVLVAGGFASWERLAVFLAFAAPAVARPVAMNLHLPIVPGIAFFLFWVLWRRLRRAGPIIERPYHA